MKVNEVEKQLKESAEDIKMEDFSERWGSIKQRIRVEKESDSRVTSAQKIAVTDFGDYSVHNNVVKKVSFAVGLCCLFLVIVLAIVLPLTLKKDETKRYLGIDELNSVNVSVEEFENELNVFGIKLFDYSDYTTSSHNLYYSKDGQLKGGYVDLLDEENAAALSVLFHTDDVKQTIELGSDSKTTVINSVQITYETLDNGTLFSSKVLSNTGKIIYEIQCITITDNIIPIFEKLFG